jgi:hypothetical protein
MTKDTMTHKTGSRCIGLVSSLSSAKFSISEWKECRQLELTRNPAWAPTHVFGIGEALLCLLGTLLDDTFVVFLFPVALPPIEDSDFHSPHPLPVITFED